ncbi:FK506-binding protein 5-like [Cydia amplana]|uniref:FK506-binding protein 5-like n=1 Tax=Cydia amplana TaxID=1869771 RepID=UPI002FE62AFE
MRRAILLCAAIATAAVGGDNTQTNNDTTNNVFKREILEFYPDWVPFKNKHGDELGEFVDVTKPKAKVKKRLALPMNFLIKAVADDDSEDYPGQGESDSDEYYEKKDWSDLDKPGRNESETVPEQQEQRHREKQHQEQQQEQQQQEQRQREKQHQEQQQHSTHSDIEGLINFITKSSPSLADDIKKSTVNLEDVNQDEEEDEIPEKTERIQGFVEDSTTITPEPQLSIALTPRPNLQEFIDDEDDSEVENKNQQQSEEEPQKLSTEEQKENEEKKRIILDSVDQLKLRHELEQRAISGKNNYDEYDDELRHRTIQKNKYRNNKRSRVKSTPPPNYDEYEDMSWKDKYNINVEKKSSSGEDASFEQFTEKTAQTTTTTTTTAKYKPRGRERAKYSLFRNPDLYTVDDPEDETIPSIKNQNTPRRFSSKYNSAENFIAPATTTEKVQPILYFPKRKLRKPKTKTTTEAIDSFVAETVEDKLTNKQTTANPITYPDITSLANDDYKTTAVGYDYPTTTMSLWKDDTSAESKENSVKSLNVQDSTPQYEDPTAADAPTGPSGEAQASDSETVTDAISASSDHKKEGPKDYHVEKGGGSEHQSSHEEEHEEHGKKAYEGLHKDSKTKKGHHDKEDHLGKYEDHGGHDKKHHDESGHFGEHVHEEHGKKHAKYEESGKHSKGHSTKGSHDVHKKEEYEKKVEFFEEEGDSGEEVKHGGYHGEKKHEEAGNFKKEKLHNNHHQNKKGESGHFIKGGHHIAHKGHKVADGHDGHGKHGAVHHRGGGHQSGKKWVYHHGYPAKNANLIVIDRRADRYTHGPNYYG